ncbi:MAG: chromate transporter [Clostridiales bacterium]|nr:chromate transporter [Clostridiales bacterium]
MIYLELLLGFLKVGLFAFGGAYAAIPLIRDVVLSNGWLDDAQLSYMIAVSESTPGPIMVNMATYVGSTRGGILGSALATAAVVTPAFIIILLVVYALRAVMENRYVKAVMDSLVPCVNGIILAVGLFMTLECILPEFKPLTVDFRAAALTALLALLLFLTRKIKFFAERKIKLSPVTLIVIASLAGILMYGV